MYNQSSFIRTVKQSWVGKHLAVYHHQVSVWKTAVENFCPIQSREPAPRIFFFFHGIVDAVQQAYIKMGRPTSSLLCAHYMWGRTASWTLRQGALQSFVVASNLQPRQHHTQLSVDEVHYCMTWSVGHIQRTLVWSIDYFKTSLRSCR